MALKPWLRRGHKDNRGYIHLIQAETEEHVARQVHPGFVHERFSHDTSLRVKLLDAGLESCCIWQRKVELEQRTRTFTPVKTTKKGPTSDYSNLTCIVTDGSSGLTLELLNLLAAMGLTQVRHGHKVGLARATNQAMLWTRIVIHGRRIFLVRHRLGESHGSKRRAAQVFT